jgi:hypothetical protein
MCAHYEDLCRQMEEDMENVKKELLDQFGGVADSRILRKVII